MNRFFIPIIILIISAKLQAQTDCHVPYRFEKTELSEAFQSWENWCNVQIDHSEVDISNIKLSGDFGLMVLKKALKYALNNTAYGWEIENKIIKIRNKNDIIEKIFVTNKFKNAPLQRIITIWRYNYKLNIDYKEKELKGYKVTAEFLNTPLDDALKEILAATPLQFRQGGNRSVKIFSRFDNPGNSDILEENVSENVNISGIIKDVDTGESLPFATAIVQGTSNGTTANLDGYFSLFNVPTDTATLEITYLGYATKNFKLHPDMNNSNLNIGLQEGGVQLDEVTVVANRKGELLKQTGISKLSMTPEIASILPSYGEKDIFRSLQLLPGVSGSNESSSGLYVRGGTPDQNLILLDGFTVYHVDHLFGFFSAFNSNSIKDVQLYKGGFGAKYGGRLSSVVDMTGKDGNTEEFNMGFNASLLSVNGFIESPFANGQGSFIITGRRSFQSNFYKNLFESFTESNEQNTGFGGGRGFGQSQTQPNSYFYDLNAKLTYRFSSKDKISVSLYNGEDDLDNSRVTDSDSFRGGPFGGGGDSNFSFVNDTYDVSNWGNIGASLKWSRQWSDKFFTNTIASFSNYFSERDQSRKVTITQADTTINRSTGTFESNNLDDFSLRIDNEYKINKNNQLDFGLQLTENSIKYEFTQNEEISLIDRDDNGITAALYLEDRITLNDKLVLTGGLRLNYFENTDKYYLEPRASLNYYITDKIKLKGAYGIYNQFATRVIREDIQQGSRDFWILADDENIPTSSASHYILGASYEAKKYLFDIELYKKDYSGLSEYTTRFGTSGFGPDQTVSLDERFFTGTGVSQGIDVLVQRKFGKLSGWLGYTLSKVKYDFPEFGDEPFYASQDQRHEFKAVAAYKWKAFDFSTTFVYASGKPYTAPVGYYELDLLDGTIEPYFVISDKNALRYPSYHRWDASANYNFNLGNSKAKLGLSIFNIYNRKNTWYKEYEVIEGELLETDVNLLGTTPSLFFNWTLK